MLRPSIDREPRLSAGARGRRPGGGAGRATRLAGDAWPHPRAGTPGAGGASGRVDARRDTARRAGAHGGAGGDRGGRGRAPGGLRGGGRRRRGARSRAAGAARRIAAVGLGSGAPPRRAGPDPRSGRAGRPHRMTAGDDVQLVTFKVAGYDFAFNIFQVERILRYGAPAPHREETRSVILEWEGGKLGVVVDAVTEVRQVEAERITAPPGIVKGLAAEYITGLVVTDGRTIIVLNTARLLSSQEKVALDTAVQQQVKV